MASHDDRAQYRALIDELVQQCREGQGAIGGRRARSGVWNPHITAESAPDQRRFNLLLARLNAEDRETLGQMLSESFTGGVHTALVALHEAEIPPFDDGYEGTPFHDFVGRLTGWAWPK